MSFEEVVTNPTQDYQSRSAYANVPAARCRVVADFGYFADRGISLEVRKLAQNRDRLP